MFFCSSFSVIRFLFSSFVVGQFVPNEQCNTLQQALIQLAANYKHVEGCKIRLDNAPGFVALTDDKVLKSIGIDLELGNIKNKNSLKSAFIMKEILDKPLCLRSYE